MDEEEIKEVMNRGGVGNFCGLILDHEGKILDIEANRRSMAVDLEKLRDRCGRIIGVASLAEKKSHAVESILKR